MITITTSTASLLGSKVRTFLVKINNLTELIAAADALSASLNVIWTRWCSHYWTTSLPSQEVNYIKTLFADKQDAYVFVTYSESCACWKAQVISHAHADEVDSNHRTPLVMIGNLRRWLIPRYVMPDGTVTSDAKKYEDMMLSSLKQEFKIYLDEYNARDKFVWNLHDRTCFGHFQVQIHLLDKYLSSKNLNRREIDTFIGNSFMHHPFTWDHTKEGYQFWFQLHSQWALHVDNVLLGIDKLKAASAQYSGKKV